MKRTSILAYALLCLVLSSSSAQTNDPNPLAPKPGAPAPPLTFNHLLQAPVATKVDWPSLHGKVVVLEFWATWCVPCIAEIPVLNSLQATLDPAKVQFLAIDDEDPAIVDKFLEKRPINGWLGFDTSSSVFERYGINARPATIIVGPDGRIAANSAHPENLKREQLLALADGKAVVFSDDHSPGSAGPAAIAERTAILEQSFSASSKSPLEISVTPGDQSDGHIMPRGQGQIDITNANVELLLRFGAGVPSTRITSVGVIPDKNYNLHLNAPGLDPTQLTSRVEQAIASATGLNIEHHTETVDAYVLTATPEASSHFRPFPYPGGADYSTQAQTLRCINATPEQLAAALEKALGAPVVDETELSGKIMITLTIPPKDLPTTSQTLAKELGLTLTRAKRPIETITLTAGSPVQPK